MRARRWEAIAQVHDALTKQIDEDSGQGTARDDTVDLQFCDRPQRPIPASASNAGPGLPIVGQRHGVGSRSSQGTDRQKREDAATSISALWEGTFTSRCAEA